MNNILDSLSVIIKNNYFIAPIIALLAGVLTSFTPCSLSTIPLVIGYVGANKIDDTKYSFRLSLVFAIGMSITLTILGILASLLGKIMQQAGSWWYIVLGIIMVLMCLQMWEIFTFVKPTYLISKNKKRGYIGAFIAGIFAGLFSSPCSTPVLIVLLAIVAQSSNIFLGSVLLLLYSIGYSFLSIIAGTFIGTVRKITTNKKYGKISEFIKYFIGILILLFAFYMFYSGF